MNKSEIIAVIQKNLGPDTKKSEAMRALQAVLDAIQLGVKRNKTVQLVGFGTFKLTTRKARKGINPQTGATIKIKASKTVRFSPGKNFKSML